MKPNRMESTNVWAGPGLVASLLLFAGRPLGAEQCEGYWASATVLPQSTAAVTGIEMAPDGRLIVGLAGAGLRIFGPNLTGTYSWSSITAGRGGLLSNNVRDLAIFGEELWTATGEGVAVWNLATGAWTSYTASNSVLPSNSVRRLTATSGSLGGVWMCTDAGAVGFKRLFFLPGGPTEVWTVLDSGDGIQPGDLPIRAIAVHKSGNAGTVWIAGAANLYRWTGGSSVELVENTGDCRFNTATAMAVDGRNFLWYATLKDFPALQRGDGGGGSLVPLGLCAHRPGSQFLLPSWTSHSDGLSPHLIHDLGVDGAGRLWVGLQGRGAVYDQGSWCFYTVAQYPLFSEWISRVRATDEAVWFGHGDGPGLTFHSPNWSRLAPQALGAPAGPAGSFLLEASATWVGVGTGVSVSVGSGWSHTAIPGNGSLVTALARDGAGTLWAGTAGSGVFQQFLNLYEPATGKGLPSPDVRAMATDSAGRLWVATSGGLALRANGYWLPFTQGTSGLVSNDLRALAVDTQDRVWIGSGNGGISILDPDGQGGGAWTRQDTGTGLPANTVNALARGPQGTIWAATTAGAAFWNGVAWTVHDAQSRALPGNECLSVNLDPAGRVWVGTAKGLAVLENDAWTHFHVTSSTLATDRVHALAADATRLYAAAGAALTVRDEVTGPIGFFPPEITSFLPASGAPGTTVTIQGKNFDDRGTALNYVTFGNTGAGGAGYPARAEVSSVTTTQLVVVVPEGAVSGPIRVTAHELEATSAADFLVAPRIDQVDPTCLALGDRITIKGAGFYGGGGGGFAEIRIGAGAWRTPANQTGQVLRDFLRPGDTAGPVRVRLKNGLQAVSPENVAVGSFTLKKTRLQQAIEGMPLIWGKRTLVHLDFESTGCKTRLTSGTLLWRKKGGDLLVASPAYTASPGGASVFLNQGAPIDAQDFGVDFVAELSVNGSPYFPRADFDGMSVVLRNNGFEAFTLELPASAFAFQDIPYRPKLFLVAVLPDEGLPGTLNSTFWENAWVSLGHVARMYPLNDFDWRWGSRRWIIPWSTYFRVSSAYLGDADIEDEENDFSDLQGRVADIADPEFGEFAMGLIDEKLYTSGATGKASLGPFYAGGTAVSFNFTKENPGDSRTGATVAQELGHLMGLVDEDASNHDSANDNHSRFDEGEGTIEYFGKQCAALFNLSFMEAIRAQRGTRKQIVRLDSGPPFDHPWGNCDDGRPRSSMSYAPNKRNVVAHLEPVDYQAIIDYLDQLRCAVDYNAPPGLCMVPGGGGAAVVKALRLRGSIDPSGALKVSVSYLEDAGGPYASDPEGEYRLVLLDARGSLLGEHGFTVEFHAHDTDEPSTFAVRVPFPEETARAEILHDGMVHWSRNVSSHPPVVSMLSPAGGTFQAEDVIPVTWTASDPDGDALQFALDYTPDGGATWHRLPQYILETAYAWQPLWIPPSTGARLRVRASDGFHTATALSAPFTLFPADPLAFIVKPEEGRMALEGERVTLAGGSQTADGEPGSFLWEVDGVPLDSDLPLTEHPFELAGPHVIRLMVIDSAGTSSAADQVTIEVIPDYDRDGMPNDFELAHRLNPLDFDDAGGDEDGDGLSNLGEHRRGSDPREADSDGDGWSDGVELERETDPANPGHFPASVPVLVAGAESLTFTTHLGDPPPAPTTFWITNGGAGSLSWTAASSAPWVSFSPAQGMAPSQVFLGASPDGLAVGLHEAQVTIASAAGGSHTIAVRLRILEPRAGEPHSHFVRGDSSGEGALDISDPILCLSYFFQGGRQPTCLDTCDANDDGRNDISDPVMVLGYLFLGTRPPSSPFPGCGPDPDARGPGCEQGTCN